MCAVLFVRQNLRSCSFPSMDPCVNLQPVAMSRRSASSVMAAEHGAERSDRRREESGRAVVAALQSSWAAARGAVRTSIPRSEVNAGITRRR